MRGGVATDGALTAWDFHNYNSGGAGIGIPYVVANQKVQFHETVIATAARVVSRTCGDGESFCARECAMDEQAHAAGMDSLEFRLKNIRSAAEGTSQGCREKFDGPGRNRQ